MMKRLLFGILIIGIYFNLSAQTKGNNWTSNHSLDELNRAPVALIPFPQKVQWLPGKLIVKQIVVKSNADTAILPALKSLLVDNGLTISANSGKNKTQVNLAIVEIPNLKKEGYQLSVSQKGINISAPDINGLYYGIQTLRQLMLKENGLDRKSVV